MLQKEEEKCTKVMPEDNIMDDAEAN